MTDFHIFPLKLPFFQFASIAFRVDFNNLSWTLQKFLRQDDPMNPLTSASSNIIPPTIVGH